MGLRDDIVNAAKQYIGVPYKSIYQGTGPEDGGFTCSGLVWRAYNDAGVDIPIAQGINSYYTGYYNGWNTQAGWILSNGHAVYDEDSLQKGDIVLYSPVWDPERTGHVAIYVGNGNVIHANGSPVAITPLSYGGNFVVGGWPLKTLPEDSVVSTDILSFEISNTIKFSKDILIRTAPDTSKDNGVDIYEMNTACDLDRIVLAPQNKYSWGSYIGNSGNRRYVSLGTHEFVDITTDGMLKFKHDVNIHSSADISTNSIVDKYLQGEKCHIDKIVIKKKLTHVLGSYVGNSGKRRYLSIGTCENCSVTK